MITEAQRGQEELNRTPARRRENLIYRQSEHWRPPLFSPTATRSQRIVAALRRYFDLQAGSAWNDLSGELKTVTGSLLDVGCGAQPFRPLVNPQASYIGLDTSDAKAHFGYEMPDTLYFTGEIWPLKDESVDCVLCTETLEHVPKPETLLMEAYRCLRPGGRLLMTVPFAARWHFIPHDYWRYTPSSLNALLETAGFEEIAVYARGNALTVACYKNMALMLPLIFSGSQSRLRPIMLLCGLLCLPLLTALAVIANLSLKLPGGDDCLGYTVFARRGRRCGR